MKERIIAGFGISGEGAGQLCQHLHLPALIVDERDTEELRKKASSFAGSCVKVLLGWRENIPLPLPEEIILSPGIRKESPLYKALEKTGGKMTGEMEFALHYIPCPFCAITGTNGKTTTTELTTALLRGAGYKAEASGNVGNSISCCVKEALEGKFDLLVIEVSSFQLESMEKFPSAPAVILNLASDHLDRHSSMEEYGRTKFKLLQGKNREERILHKDLLPQKEKFLGEKPVTFFSPRDAESDFHAGGEKLYYRENLLFDFRESPLAGEHNKENILAAFALVKAIAGEEALYKEEVLSALRSFTPSLHRMELFAEKDGVKYINDSKATNPHAVIACCRVFGNGEKPNLYLLTGGLDKDMDFSELAPILPFVKKFFLIGECREKLASFLRNTQTPFILCDTFEEGVKKGMEEKKEKGDAFILAPATASMDLFKNYQQRGETFKKLVLAHPGIRK